MVSDFEKYNDLYPGAGTGADIRAAVDDPKKHAKILAAVAGDLDTDSTVANGQVSGSPAQVAKNPAEAGSTLTSLSQNGYYAVGLLNRFAGQVDTFDGKVDTLNTKLQKAPKGKRQAKKTELQPQWDEAFGNLEDGAESTGSDFGSPPSKEKIREPIQDGHLPLTDADSWPGLTLTADDKKQFYKNAVDGGALPDIATMTEEERKQFNKENPGLLDALMKLDKPSEEDKKAILALAVPRLTGADGTSAGTDVRDALKNNASPEDFAKAFATVGEFGAYAKWAQQHGGLPVSADQTAYLKNFYEKIGPDINGRPGSDTPTIAEYIAANEHKLKTGTEEVESPGPGPGTTTKDIFETYAGFSESEQEGMSKSLADGLLLLSDEDLTTDGGYDALPSEVRGAIEDPTNWATGGATTSNHHSTGNPAFENIVEILSKGEVAGGDDLSRNLGVAAYYHSQVATDTDQYGDSDEGDTTAQIALELAGRNTQAAHDLLTGENMDDVPVKGLDPYYAVQGGEGDTTDYSAKGFNTWLFNHQWDDNGEAAAEMIDWTAQPKPEDAGLAEEAYKSVYDTIAADDDTYKKLIGSKDDPSVGEQNPLLTRALAGATGGHLDLFDTNPADAAEEKARIKMMMLINTDHPKLDDESPDPNGSAVRLAAAIEAYQQQRVLDSLDPDHGYADDDPHQKGLVGEHTGRLAGYSNAALRNVVYGEHMSDEAKALEVAQTKQKAIGLISSAIPFGNIPTGTVDANGDSIKLGHPGSYAATVLTTVLQDQIKPEEVDVTDPITTGIYDIDPETADGGNLELITRGQYLDSMLQQDPDSAARYKDLGIIDPKTGHVDLSQVDAADVDRINEDLAGLMPAGVNKEVGEVVDTRNEIGNRYGLTDPEEFGND